ncbi:chemotaxis protein CheW [Fusibacter sp. 3D3]|uniref:chemotaxis protein CheW n=1 Tax=Fusibacter sp. 3D3 TaxID=1048380 RepID=UPI000853ECC2|nr:chemotaxis protein CheW [Fusibacter sp. 3D3]GAU76298.1 positive regulator of CheA protein activity [Fusibacter sp. 3D3]
MQILIFIIKEKEYAIEINRVDTIEKLETMTYIPKARKEIMGLISSRGHIITVMDTSKIVKQMISHEVLKKLIIITVRGEKIALAVTDIEDVVDIDEQNLEFVDDDKEVSVVKINGRVVMLLNENQLNKLY